MSKIQRVRGTRDLMHTDCQKIRFIESTGLKQSLLAGYEEIETPLFEFSEVFHRGLGESSDVVHKETYTFLDRGGDSITLRPEGTAGVARAFVSEGMAQNLPLKLYYFGSMFRYERPQKGRYRQFKQMGVEHLGVESPWADVESIALGFNVLNSLKVMSNCQLELNTLGDHASRDKYRLALVNYFTKYQSELSADSKMRLEKNPLRILDSKDENDKKLIIDAPIFENSLSDDSKKFFAQVQEGLTLLGIKFVLNPRLVRGLDYYCHTVFEFTTQALGAQGTVLAGGRFDGLIEMMGGPKTPGVGWGSGVDRLVELVDASLLPKTEDLITLLPADQAGEAECLKLANELRKNNLKSEILWSGNVGKKMKKANAMNAKFALIIGESEVSTNEVSVKNLQTGEQKKYSRNELIQSFFS